MTHVPNPPKPSHSVEDESPADKKWREEREKALEILKAPNPKYADHLTAERIRDSQASIKAARRMRGEQEGVRTDGEAFTKAFEAMKVAKAAFEQASNELQRHEQAVEQIIAEQKAAIEAEAQAAKLDAKSGLHPGAVNAVPQPSNTQLEHDAAQGINKPTAAELAANPNAKPVTREDVSYDVKITADGGKLTASDPNDSSTKK